MLSEPKSKQKNKNEIHQFVVLNHTVFSNIATIASTVLSRKQNKYSESIIRTAKKAYHTLLDSFQKFEEPITGELFYKDEEENNATETIDDLSIKEHL
jgi:hypothetical protein